VEIAEDAMTGPDDRRGLAFHELPVGVPVAGEDNLDDRAIIEVVVGARG
jgi:hypothetical protein